MRMVETHRSGLDDANMKVRIEVCTDPDTRTGASNKYQFFIHRFNEWEKAGRLDFQEGPIVDEKGVVRGMNGITNEALLAVVLDRLQGYQKGRFSCYENGCAIQRLEEALHWLHARTTARARRGVAGKHEE